MDRLEFDQFSGYLDEIADLIKLTMPMGGSGVPGRKHKKGGEMMSRDELFAKLRGGGVDI